MTLLRTKPPHNNMRYAEMERWLKEEGFTANFVRTLVDQGVIRGHPHYAGGKHLWFNAEEIRKAFSVEEHLDGNREWSEVNNDNRRTEHRDLQ